MNRNAAPSTALPRTDEYLAPSSETARLHARASRVMVGGTSRIHYFFEPYPIYARSGKGAYVTDVDGTERVDFLFNMTTLIHGHADAAINRALREQLDQGASFSEPEESEVRLAELIAQRVASVEKIRFANSGTEAVMLALKLARAHTGRSRIAKFEGFYHGYYDHVQVSYASRPEVWGPPEAPASVASSGGLAESVEREVVVLPFNDRASVERLFEEHGHTLAALVVDPLSNRGGFPKPAPGFFDFLRRLTRAHGVVLVFDEVISFRLGYHGAQGRYGGAPDLTAFGKIIGGGLPVGAVGGRSEIMALLDPTDGPPEIASGGTFSGNPLSMTAGLAAMQRMTPPLYERLDVLGERLRRESDAVFSRAGIAAQLSGDGSLFRIVAGDAPIRRYRDLRGDPAAAAWLGRLHRELLASGIIVAREGLGCLATVMGDAEVDRFLEGLETAVRSAGSPG